MRKYGREHLERKKWDSGKMEESWHQHKEMQLKVKKKVGKGKQKAYDELYERLGTKEGEMDLYWLVKQMDWAGKDVPQAINDRDGSRTTSNESVIRDYEMWSFWWNYLTWSWTVRCPEL